MERPKYDSPFVFTAIQAAQDAGNILEKGFGTVYKTSTKDHPLNLVTEYDMLAEKAIIDFIEDLYPTHGFIAEESGFTTKDNAPVHWIIDPLDGTMNFAHQIPLFGTSIAAQVGDQIEVGVIYLPFLEELFVAQRGRGAYLNGKPIKTSSLTDLSFAVGSTGFTYSSPEERQQSLHMLTNLAARGNPVRMLGSSTISLAYLAAGRIDLYWTPNLKPWDSAAGMLIVQEAGGNVTHFDGSPFDPLKRFDMIATNGPLHKEAMQCLL